MTKAEARDAAVRLVRSVHCAVDWGRMSPYRLRYWSMLSERIEGAARTTNDLATAFTELCKSLFAEPAGRAGLVKEIGAVLSLSETEREQVLAVMRSEGSTISVLVRVSQQEKKKRGGR